MVCGKLVWWQQVDGRHYVQAGHSVAWPFLDFSCSSRQHEDKQIDEDNSGESCRGMLLWMTTSPGYSPSTLPRSSVHLLEVYYARLNVPVGLALQCDAAVDEYLPQLLAVLQTVTPAELCHILSFCPFEVGSPRLGKDECLMCHFLVLELRFKLEKPETQASAVAEF
jgi:hypothetical protein